MHPFKTDTQEAEVGESLWGQGQLGLYGKFQASQAYIVSSLSQR